MLWKVSVFRKLVDSRFQEVRGSILWCSTVFSR